MKINKRSEMQTNQENSTSHSQHGNGVGDMMWKYEQLRAGRVYAKFMFNTREEAENFAMHMTKVEPDLFSRIEPVEARAVWN